MEKNLFDEKGGERERERKREREREREREMQWTQPELRMPEAGQWLESFLALSTVLSTLLPSGRGGVERSG